MDKLSENLKPFIPICTVIIAFTAVLSFLLVGVNVLLSPIKANQTRIEKELKANQTRIEKELKTELKEIKDTLKKVVEKQGNDSKPRRGTASQEK